MYAFGIKVAIFLLNLAMIGQIVKITATVFSNLRWRQPLSWIFETMHFRHHQYVPNRSANVSTNFGDDWSNSKKMATVFRNSRWRQPPSWICATMHFLPHWYVQNRSPNISTNFGEDWSNSKEMAAVFLNPRRRQPPSWKSTLRLNHDHEKLIPSL